jgi:hypothetical protein
MPAAIASSVLPVPAAAEQRDELDLVVEQQVERHRLLALRGMMPNDRLRGVR